MKRILFLLLLLWSSFVKAQSCETFDTVRTNASSLITYNSARINGSISHIAPGQIVTIILKYVRTGQTDTASSSGTSTLRNLTGLQASTEYNYYYSTVCPSSTVSQTAGAYTFTTLANTVNYTPMAAMGYQFKYLKADSGLMAPRRDTTIGRAPDYGGQIVWKPDDSTFYGYNGEYWHALAIDSAGIITLLNDKVDSVTVAGDSLWYWKQGVSYGYILPTQSNEWDLEGNSGTTAGTNFVGTTDNVDLVLKSNAIERMRWNTSGALGLGSGTDYGTSGYVLTSQGNAAAPVWAAASGGATPTWQQTLTAGSTLMGTNTIDGGGNSIYFENLSDIHFEAVGIYPTTAPFMEFISVNATTNRESSIDIQDDSINIKPSLGQLHIDTLNYSDAADDSMMVWSNVNGGAVGMRAIPSGGGISGIGNYEDSIANVLEYGAAGDGVTEDSAAFQAAIATGKPVYVPYGTYLVTGTLTLQAGQRFFGSGTLRTTTSGTNSYYGMYHLIVAAENCIIEGLTFIGSGKGTYTASYTLQNAIQLTGWGISITNCNIKKFNGSAIIGMEFNGAAFVENRNIRVSDCLLDSNTVGFYGYNNGFNYSIVDNCSITENLYGVIANAPNMTFSACNISYNSTGVYASTAGFGDRNIFIGCHINHNTAALNISLTSNGYNFNGCTFYYGTITLANCDKMIFSGCAIALNGAAFTVSGTSTTKTVTLVGGYEALTATSWVESGTGKIVRFGIQSANAAGIGVNTVSPTSSLHVNGSVATGYRAITALRTLDGTDHTINCTANTFTVTAPSAVGIAGRQYTIVNSGSGTITIGSTSSQTFTNINGTPTTLTLAPVGAGAIVSYTIVSDGANWIVVSKVKDE